MNGQEVMGWASFLTTFSMSSLFTVSIKSLPFRGKRKELVSLSIKQGGGKDTTSLVPSAVQTSRRNCGRFREKTDRQVGT